MRLGYCHNYDSWANDANSVRTVVKLLIQLLTSFFVILMIMSHIVLISYYRVLSSLHPLYVCTIYSALFSLARKFCIKANHSAIVSQSIYV